VVVVLGFGVKTSKRFFVRNISSAFKTAVRPSDLHAPAPREVYIRQGWHKWGFKTRVFFNYLLFFFFS